MPVDRTDPNGIDADALIEAGHAARRTGARHEARAYFERALYRLSGRDAASRASAVLRWIARTYMMDGDPQAALDCATAAVAVARACGDRAAEGHALNAQGSVRWMQGDPDTAEWLYAQARLRGLEAGEQALIAMTSANLGAIVATRGDLPEALRHCRAALDIYRELDCPIEVSMAFNNIGRLYTDLRRWPEAEHAFAEALALSEAGGDLGTRIGVEVNAAEMWLARGKGWRAARALDNATRLSSDCAEGAWIAQIAKLRGILKRDAGDVRAAEQYFAEAVRVAESRQDMVLLAETLRELAELCHTEGRNREALQNLNRAHRLFTRLHAKRELANVDRSLSRLEDDFVEMVRQWGESIEAKDRYTQGHCERVADLSCAIAVACGIEGQALFWFRIGALLHDVGKLVVPSEILNKTGKLDADEWALMKSHTIAGVDMLAGVDFPWDVRPIIESHHERWDGGGYPHGLQGEDIPLSARILAVADVYDALTSVRSYKPAFTHDMALDIMRRQIGLAFDPDVFAKFDEIVRAGTLPSAAPRITLKAV